MTNQIRAVLQRPRAAIMGIVNTTPDSFYDGGQAYSVDAALKQSLRFVSEGADLLDIGGESTRPGADPVSEQEELDRVIPVIERIQSESDVPISIDTYKPAVMRAAIAAGASMVNDINGLQAKGALQAVASDSVPVCIMHKQGSPKTMQDHPDYNNVVESVTAFFDDRLRACEQHGIPAGDVILDPGIGFGKTLEHNLLLLQAIPMLIQRLKCDVLIGVSRKSMIDQLFGRAVEQRMAASVGLAVQAVLNGAKIVRVHDVGASHDAVRSVEAVRDISPD